MVVDYPVHPEVALKAHRRLGPASTRDQPCAVELDAAKRVPLTKIITMDFNGKGGMTSQRHKLLKLHVFC